MLDYVIARLVVMLNSMLFATTSSIYMESSLAVAMTFRIGVFVHLSWSNLFLIISMLLWVHTIYPALK